MLMTLRSHDQFNTTVYSDEDRYRGISRSRRVLLLHPEDLRERGLENGERITITSHFGQGQDAQTRQLKDFFVVPYDVPRGSAVAYFPEANPLIFAGSFAAQSRTPTSKSTRVTIERQRDLPGADAAH
jgi:anaerobic selenocysteine-containing dehydrogenase